MEAREPGGLGDAVHGDGPLGSYGRVEKGAAGIRGVEVWGELRASAQRDV